MPAAAALAIGAAAVGAAAVAAFAVASAGAPAGAAVFLGPHIAHDEVCDGSGYHYVCDYVGDLHIQSSFIIVIRCARI